VNMSTLSFGQVARFANVIFTVQSSRIRLLVESSYRAAVVSSLASVSTTLSSWTCLMRSSLRPARALKRLSGLLGNARKPVSRTCCNRSSSSCNGQVHTRFNHSLFRSIVGPLVDITIFTAQRRVSVLWGAISCRCFTIITDSRSSGRYLTPHMNSPYGRALSKPPVFGF